MESRSKVQGLRSKVRGYGFRAEGEGKHKCALSYARRLSAIIILSLAFFGVSLPAYSNQVKEIEANGVKAWVIEDNFLPIISVQVAFKHAGYATDSQDKKGLAHFVSGMLNEGAGKYSSQEFQRELEENAIGFVPDLDQDNFYLSVKTLSDNLDKTLDLTSAALASPKFGNEETERVRGQIISLITKAQEDPQEVVNRKFLATYFGKHPYANPKEGEVDSVKTITSEDMKSYVKSAFAKDNIVIAIVGDVDEGEAKKIVARLTEKLPEKSAVKQVAEFKDYPKGGDEKVVLNNPQTYVMFGTKGVARNDKDYYAAFVLNSILGGGGFQSRLMQEVREKNGLAYSVGTGLMPMDSANLLYGLSSTKNESVEESIKIIKEQFKSLSENGVTESELEDAKAYLTGSFGLNLDKNEKLAFFLLSMQLEGLPQNFVEKRNDYINSVTIDQVNKVSKWLLEPNSLIFVRVGL